MGIGRTEPEVVDIVVVVVDGPSPNVPGKEMGRVETCLRPRTWVGVEAEPSEYRPDQAGASNVSHSSKGGA